MAEELGSQYRPYASVGNIMDLIRRYRSMNLPPLIDASVLNLLGVSEPSHSRIFAALRFFGLINAASEPMPEWKAICTVPEEDLGQQLAGIVQRAYADILQKVDPASDPVSRIQSAFQPYQPRSQKDRMAALFLGLCREAGMPVMDSPKRRPTQMQGLKVSRPANKPQGPERQRMPARGSSTYQPPAPATGVLFGVTEDDIAVLSETEFQEVWSALGKVARARSKARQPAPETSELEAAEEQSA